MAKKRVKTWAGSFPAFALSRGLTCPARKEWQVLCGDKGHWRVGYYRPPHGPAAAGGQLEKHTCLELFLLLEGELTLILDDGNGEYQLPLEPLQPVMVAGWHNGFAPRGPFSALALVIERDHFTTFYRER
jgi:hypothetical protein